MLKTKTYTTSVDSILECMEDDDLESHATRIQSYSDIINLLNEIGISSPTLDAKYAERLISICLRDLTTDLKYASNALTLVTLILEHIQKGRCDPVPNLLESAVSILKVTKKVNLLNKVHLQTLCINALVLYPDKTLEELVTLHYTDVFNIFDFSTESMNQEGFYKAHNLLFKILNLLSPEKKLKFVQDGVDIWFRTTIPYLLYKAPQNLDYLKEIVPCLQLLVDTLVNIDYSNNIHWENFVRKITDVKAYPSFLRKLVEMGNDDWDKLWIIFVKLLKGEITKVNTSGISPINALLPVIEFAFKLDSNCRCKAFQSWNVLIDNFSTDLKQSLELNRRFKLLIIPLKLNNAKEENVALAKFNTWWHLIRRIDGRMDKFSELILLPFLNFCFGKPDSQAKPPGQMTKVVARKCLEALTEIVGHVECSGCVSLPPLKARLMCIKLLVDHWSDLVHSLTSALKSHECVSDEENQAVVCLWSSFFLTISELPENQIRADLVGELLKVMQYLILEENEKLQTTGFCILLKSLFKNRKIKQLLKTKRNEGPLFKIVEIVTSATVGNFYSRQPSETIQATLKPFTDQILCSSSVQPDDIIAFFIRTLPTQDNYLDLYICLVESIRDGSYRLNPATLLSVVLWPLKNMDKFSKKKSESLWYKWYILYNSVLTMIPSSLLNQEVSKTLNFGHPTNDYLSLGASLALLRRKLVNDKDKCCLLKEIDLIILVLCKMKTYKEVESFLPILIDTLVLLLNKKTNNINDQGRHGVKIINMAFILINEGLKIKDMINTNELNIIDNFLREIDLFFQQDANTILQPIISDTILESITLVDRTHPLRASLLALLKTCMTKSKDINGAVYKDIKTVFEIIEKQEEELKKEHDNKDKNDNNFPVPESKAPKSKNKEPRILSTVVDNGEEFVVVKSNWKFNPKNLTEAQKDKLKRKREDIPALYQDLSQSQDEFKLTAWKTDSQDASTTVSSNSNSKSANEDVSSILKNMASTEVVPNIIDNLLSDASHKNTEKNEAQPSVSVAEKQVRSPAVRDPKSPRLALKDRVFKNVRSLIEKSGLSTDDGKTTNNVVVVEDMNQIVNEVNLKTPVSKVKPNSNATNSAPPKITSERPSRAIKKPKKFEDSEIIALGRKRRSQGSFTPDGEVDKNKKVTKGNQNEDADKHVDAKVTEIKPSDNLKQEEIVETNQKEEETIVPVVVIENSGVSQNVQENSKNSQNEQVQLDVVKQEDNLKLTEQVQEQNIPIEMDMCKEKTDVPNETTNDMPKEPENLNVTPDNSSQVIEEIVTPKPFSKKKDNGQQSTIKKKRSRIEKQLLIDMVEGHPLLSQPDKTQSEKRISKRGKNDPEDNVTKRRKSLIEKSNKLKAELLNTEKKGKEKDKTGTSKQKSTSVQSSQESLLDSSQDIPMSEDVIESSQDSSVTTISVRSASKKRVPVVSLSKSNPLAMPKATETQKLIDEFKTHDVDKKSSSQEDKEDIELPKNKTAVEDKEGDLTETLDTEPIDSSGEVFIVNDEEPPVITINTENTVGKETQELADADTLPMEVDTINLTNTGTETVNINLDKPSQNKSQNDADITHVPSLDVTPPIPETSEAIADVIAESSNTESPFKNSVKNKKEKFLNDTIEISPIKTMSPVKEKTPSPDMKNCYVVIKLTSPVHSNGEPYNEKCDSPEVFTEDKISPEKKDQSPPRKEPAVPTNTSPSSSLSLKKNRPQMRFNGRAAQMLGLCIAENNKNEDLAEREEARRSPVSTPARRNLRTVYGESDRQADDGEDSENFLKFKRNLPTSDSSPAGPILKRKLADITDETTVSPASKRKRVSFHDPPVSTTVAVQKYIEPCGIRSPQNSAIKRQERQLRALNHHHLKSPKRLDKVFRLDTILTKAVESFSDTTMNDTVSLDETPAAEVIKTSELNDKDPICPELVNCKDPIQNIAGDLSSNTTKALLIKELEGKIETIADLAKMTELEVNRLCIKAPKIKVAKKVLNDYAAKKAAEVKTPEPVIVEPVVQTVSTEVQTNDILTTCSEMQTVEVSTSVIHTQTDMKPIAHCSVQTNESGSKSTKELVATCLIERPDFVERLTEQLPESSIQTIANKLPFEPSLEMLLKKMTVSNSKELLNRALAKCSVSTETSENLNLIILQDYLCNRFDSQSLILFCSQLLKKVHEKFT